VDPSAGLDGVKKRKFLEIGSFVSAVVSLRRLTTDAQPLYPEEINTRGT
jgi:hypothetical protein